MVARIPFHLVRAELHLCATYLSSVGQRTNDA